MAYTEAQVITELKNAIKIFDELSLKFSSAAPNYLGLEDTLITSLHGDYSDAVLGAVAAVRSSLNTALGLAPLVVEPILREWAQILTSPDLAAGADIATILTRIYERMITSGDRIKSRVITFGNPAAAGGNAGNGSIKRLTKDDHGFDLEACYMEAKVAKCTKDASLGQTKHKETFEIRGATANKDLLSLAGSSGSKEITCRDAQDSIVNNSSFEQYDNAAAPTTINLWTPATSINNFAIDTANYYRGWGADDATTHQSLKIKANDGLSQSRVNFRNQIPKDLPVYAQLAYNRAINGCNDGTLKLWVGSQVATVVLAAQAGWNVLSLPLDQNLWYRNLKQQDLVIKVELVGSATFNVLVDEVLVTPFDFFDGTYYCPIGGLTPFLVEDYFTWSDSAVDSILQRWLWRMFNRMLPASTGGGITIADP